MLVEISVFYGNGTEVPTPHPSAELTPSPRGEGLYAPLKMVVFGCISGQSIMYLSEF